MNSRNWPGYWYPQAHPNPYPYPNHYPNSTTVAGQNPGLPPYQYGGYGYPAWQYYPQTSGYWSASALTDTNQVQASAITSMMPPNVDPYESNLQEEPYKEMWESPQSPQSPWIRAYEKYENEEK